MTPRDSDDRAALPYRVHVEIRRPQKVTDAHRRDVLRLLGFGALTFRAICDRYAYEASIGRSVDRGLVRRTLRSLIDRGEVMAVKTRRPPQHLVGRKGKSKHERKPMTVYAVTAGAFAWLQSIAGPNVTTITVVGDLDRGMSEPLVILTGATPEDSERVRSAIALRFPLLRCRVRP